LLHIALPLTAAYLAEMGMVITDMVIVGRLGSDELAAVGLAGDLFWIFLMIGMGALSLVSVLAAQAVGAGDPGAATNAAEQGMVAAALTSLPIMALVGGLGALLALAGQDADVVRLADEYTGMLMWAVPPALWFTVQRNFTTALAQSAIVGWITGIALLANAALNITLVYGAFGVPGLGVAGAGLGTTLVNWGMFLALGFYLQRSSRFESYPLRWFPRRLRLPVLAELFRLGLPAALTQIVYGGVFSAAAVAAGAISALALAAQQVIYSIIYMACAGAWAIADALRVRVAFGAGRRDAAACRRSTSVALRLAALTLFPAALLLWFAPELLVSIFLDDDSNETRDVLAIAGSLSVYAGLFLVVDGVQVVLANALRGLRDTRSPLYASLLGYWGLGLLPGLGLAFGLGLGAHGIWLGLLTGVLVATVLLTVVYRVRSSAPALHASWAEEDSPPR
jgi:MATE family multidrug resistance protein